MLQNKLGITSEAELAREEELLTKRRAIELFDLGLIEDFEVGTYKGLSAIHGDLFQDIYDFAGRMRDVNIAKGNFRFAPRMYLPEALAAIDRMPQGSFVEIVEKYVEMNVVHPFREGNGRATRIWLDCILKNELCQVVDWSLVDREDYLLAMERSPVRDTEIKTTLASALTRAVDDRMVFMKGIDASYRYEGYAAYPIDGLGQAAAIQSVAAVDPTDCPTTSVPGPRRRVSPPLDEVLDASGRKACHDGRPGLSDLGR